jgi:hypothetical protein
MSATFLVPQEQVFCFCGGEGWDVFVSFFAGIHRRVVMTLKGNAVLTEELVEGGRIEHGCQ